MEADTHTQESVIVVDFAQMLSEIPRSKQKQNNNEIALRVMGIGTCKRIELVYTCTRKTKKRVFFIYKKKTDRKR